MNKQRGRTRDLLLVAAGVIAIFLLTGCNNKKQLPDGTGYQTETSGICDDTDPTTNGSPPTATPTSDRGQYTSRDASRSCVDGGTEASSLPGLTPSEFNILTGSVIAQVGQHSTGLASAVSSNKSWSTLDVRAQEQLTCTVDLALSASLKSGTSNVRIFVVVFDSSGRQVGQTPQFSYDFMTDPQNANAIKVSLNGQGKPDIANPGTFSDSQTNWTLTLQPGIYKIQFEMNVQAQADGRGRVLATGTAKFQ